MKRRSFIQSTTSTAGLFILSPHRFLRSSRQPLITTYWQLATSVGATILRIGEETEYDEIAQFLADQVMESAVSSLVDEFDRARQALDVFQRAIPDAQGLIGAAREKAVEGFDVYLDSVAVGLKEALEEARDTGQVLITVTAEQLECLTSCLRETQTCVGSQWPKALVCAVGSLPTLRFGLRIYTITVETCLGPEIVVACGPAIAECAENCLRS